MSLGNNYMILHSLFFAGHKNKHYRNNFIFLQTFQPRNQFPKSWGNSIFHYKNGSEMLAQKIPDGTLITNSEIVEMKVDFNQQKLTVSRDSIVGSEYSIPIKSNKIYYAAFEICIGNTPNQLNTNYYLIWLILNNSSFQQ